MKYNAQHIAELLSGQIDGDPNAEVVTIARIEEAGSGALAFLANPKYTSYLYTTKASVVLVSKDFVPERHVEATMIRVADPYSAFASLLETVQKERSRKTGVAANASIHPTAKVGEDVYIGDFSYIGEESIIGKGVKIFPQVYIGDSVKIGDNTTIYAGVKINHDTVIGSGCIIHSGVVIGADGFGFAVQDDNQYKKVIQTGNVILEDDVEVGANTTIDRATLGSTIIRRGVKLDNLIQIAHNVEIGSNSVIAAQTGISGSTKLGSRCMVAGQVGFVGHIEIADDVKVGAQSGVSGNVKEKGAVLLGSPAIDAGIYRRLLVWFRRLPELAARIQNLENSEKRKIQKR